MESAILVSANAPGLRVRKSPPIDAASASGGFGLSLSNNESVSLMDETTQTQFSDVPQALEDLRQGKMIVLVDAEDRENEGDLVCAAEKVTPQIINFMARFGRGLICLPLTPEKCDMLGLYPQTLENTARFSTAFTVSVDAAEGISTGISAADRATPSRWRLRTTAEPATWPGPGTSFPCEAAKVACWCGQGRLKAPWTSPVWPGSNLRRSSARS